MDMDDRLFTWLGLEACRYRLDGALDAIYTTSLVGVDGLRDEYQPWVNTLTPDQKGQITYHLEAVTDMEAADVRIQLRIICLSFLAGTVAAIVGAAWMSGFAPSASSLTSTVRVAIMLILIAAMTVAIVRLLNLSVISVLFCVLVHVRYTRLRDIKDFVGYLRHLMEAIKSYVGYLRYDFWGRIAGMFDLATLLPGLTLWFITGVLWMALSRQNEIADLLASAALASASALLASWGLTLVFLLVIAPPVYRVWRRRQLTRKAHSILVVQLLEIMLDLFFPADAWRWEHRQELCGLLERAAVAVEGGLRRHWLEAARVRDTTTSVWIDRRSAEIAAGLRLLKRWLITPKKDTLDYFRACINDSLVRILDEDWDGLLCEEPEHRGGGAAWRTLARALGVGVAPVVAFEALRWSGILLLDEPASTVIRLSLYYWLMTNILTTIDPDAGSKLTIAKDVRDMLSGRQR